MSSTPARAGQHHQRAQRLRTGPRRVSSTPRRRARQWARRKGSARPTAARAERERGASRRAPRGCRPTRSSTSPARRAKTIDARGRDAPLAQLAAEGALAARAAQRLDPGPGGAAGARDVDEAHAGVAQPREGRRARSRSRSPSRSPARGARARAAAIGGEAAAEVAVALVLDQLLRGVQVHAERVGVRSRSTSARRASTPASRACTAPRFASSSTSGATSRTW